jgi:hypothetical protein
LSRDEFVQMLAAQFSLSERARTSKTDLLLELEQLLRRRHEAQETTVLIVDEAQSLSSALLEEIRLLSNIETSTDKLLSLVVAGQPELATRLNDQSLRQFKQRIALRCELRPLSLAESGTYIARRVTAAGGVPAQIFTREAVELLHGYARGIPRTINVLADNALLSGFATAQRMVTRQLVSEACTDFDFAVPQPATREAPADLKAARETPAPVKAPRSSDALTAAEQRIVDSAIPASVRSTRSRVEQIANWAAPTFGAFGPENVDRRVPRLG